MNKKLLMASVILAIFFFASFNLNAGNTPKWPEGKVFGAGIILSALLLVGQLYMCSKACMSGQCGRSMSKSGMGMMNHMNMPILPMPNAPEAPEAGK